MNTPAKLAEYTDWIKSVTRASVLHNTENERKGAIGYWKGWMIICAFVSLSLSLSLDTHLSYSGIFITKTCLYNFDPLQPHFYIVKLGLTGVYIIFLFLLKNIDCGYSLVSPRRGSNEYTQSMFWAEKWKISSFFLSENFQFLEVKFSIYLNRRVFVMEKKYMRVTYTA